MCTPCVLRTACKTRVSEFWISGRTHHHFPLLILSFTPWAKKSTPSTKRQRKQNNTVLGSKSLCETIYGIRWLWKSTYFLLWTQTWIIMTYMQWWNGQKLTHPNQTTKRRLNYIYVVDIACRVWFADWLFSPSIWSWFGPKSYIASSTPGGGASLNSKLDHTTARGKYVLFSVRIGCHLKSAVLAEVNSTPFYICARAYKA